MSGEREKTDGATGAADSRKSPSKQPTMRNIAAEPADDPFAVFEEWAGAAVRTACDRALRVRLP